MPRYYFVEDGEVVDLGYGFGYFRGYVLFHGLVSHPGCVGYFGIGAVVVVRTHALEHWGDFEGPQVREQVAVDSMQVELGVVQLPVGVVGTLELLDVLD